MVHVQNQVQNNVAESAPCFEPCAEPDPPEPEPSHAQPEPAQSSHEPLDEPGIEDDWKHQCDCDGYGNDLPDGSYIISMEACHECPWCVWKNALEAFREKQSRSLRISMEAFQS